MRGPDAIGEPDAGVAHAHARGLEPGRQAGQRGRRVERDRGVDAERPVARPQPRAHEPGVVVARHDDDLRRAPEPGAERAQDRLGDVHGLARAPLQQLHDVAQQHQPLDAVQRGEQRLQRLGATQDVAAEPGAEVQIGDDEGGHGRAGWWHSDESLTKVRDMHDVASGAGGRRGDPAGAGLQPQRHAAHRRPQRRVPRARAAARRLAGAVGDRRRRHRPADPARAPRPRLGLPQPPRPLARAGRARRRAAGRGRQARADRAPHRRRARRARPARPPQRRARLIAARLAQRRPARTGWSRRWASSSACSRRGSSASTSRTPPAPRPASASSPTSPSSTPASTPASIRRRASRPTSTSSPSPPGCSSSPACAASRSAAER